MVVDRGAGVGDLIQGLAEHVASTSDNAGHCFPPCEGSVSIVRLRLYKTVGLWCARRDELVLRVALARWGRRGEKAGLQGCTTGHSPSLASGFVTESAQLVQPLAPAGSRHAVLRRCRCAHTPDTPRADRAIHWALLRSAVPLLPKFGA